MKRREMMTTMVTGLCALRSGVFAKALKNTPLLPVTVKELHAGTLEIDLRMFNGFVLQPQQMQDFYVAGRAALASPHPEQALTQVCQKFGIQMIGVPMLGDVTHDGVTVWAHLAETDTVQVIVQPVGGGGKKTFVSDEPGRFPVVFCTGLDADRAYRYQLVYADGGRVLGEGQFTTPPTPRSESPFTIAFGSDYHKVGIHRPELMRLIRDRGNRAVVLTGDLATDDRRGDPALVAADYLLRDLSPAWQAMAANVPVYASWDDHDYYDNDASGSAFHGKPINVDALRKTWRRQWNNPANAGEGIYFDTQIGPVHLIMTDSRSCRVHEQQGARNSYLGPAQMAWLKKTISESTAPYIIVSGGTMWSDYISEAKDSWGVWDREGREEIFQRIDAKDDAQVILLSGDRHGARGFAIPRPNGKKIFEFEAGTLGGIRGPKAIAPNAKDQLFGYDGISTWAFGELAFETVNGERQVTVRLVNDHNRVLESITLKNGWD